MTLQSSGTTPQGRPTYRTPAPAEVPTSIISQGAGMSRVARTMYGTDERYPAVIIMHRPATPVHPTPKVIIDSRVLLDRVDLEEQMERIRGIESAFRTEGLYSYTVTPADRALDVAADIERKLWQNDDREDMDALRELRQEKEAASRGMV